MANIARVQVLWQGIPGMPGYTNFYCDAAASIPLGAITSFFDAYKASVPTGLNWTIPNTGDIFDSTTGLLNGTWTQGTVSTVTSTSVGSTWAGNAGSVTNWTTAGIANGRRVRGRTFMVPLVVGAFDNGSLTSSALSTFRAAANTLVSTAGNDLRIWHRPVGGAGGSAHAITGANVPDLAASMRSRRD